MNHENTAHGDSVRESSGISNADGPIIANATGLSGFPRLDSFRYRAEVDYLEVRVGLNRASNHDTVRRKTFATYVKSLDAGPGGAATQFRIRFDDPASREQLTRTLEILRLHYGGFSLEPRLEKIEIAFDCYSRTQCKADLKKMTERLFRKGAEYCSGNIRMTRKFGEVEWAENYPIFKAKLDQGFTIVVGDSDANIAQRIYCKTTDQGGKPLPEDQHRARREVTLKGLALDEAGTAFQSLLIDDSVPWKFEALSKWFRFREVKPGVACTPLQRMALGWQVLQGVRNPRRPGRRVYDRRSQADTALNELARDSLRELSRRFSATKWSRH